MIPIYRAKKIDSDEWVEGDLIHDCFGKNRLEYYISKVGYGSDEIDIKTLSIHFPNMIDKNGKKIFASLSEDGFGGDEIKSYSHVWTNDGKAVKGFVLYGEKSSSIVVKILNGGELTGVYVPSHTLLANLKNCEVIGIHKG